MSKVSSTKLGWTELTGERSRYRGTNEIRFAYLQLFVKKKSSVLSGSTFSSKSRHFFLIFWRIHKIDSGCQMESPHSHRLCLTATGGCAMSWPLARWLETFMTVVFMHAYIHPCIHHAFTEYFQHILDAGNAGKQDLNHQLQQ